MYKYGKATKTTIKSNKGYQGETIEQKLRRMLNNKEPINDASPIIYTERKDGVQPAYNIRTDRWEVAVDAMDKVQQMQISDREERAAKKEQAKVVDLGAKGPEGTQATDNK